MPTAPSYFFLSLMSGAAWGGSEELWYRTALYLSKKGVKTGCAVYDWPEKESRLQQLEAAGCAVYRLPLRKKKSGLPVKKLLTKLRYQKSLRQAINALPVQAYETTVINQGGFEVYTTAWQAFFKRLNRYALLFHNYNEGHVFSARQKAALQNWISGAIVNGFASAQGLQTLQKQLGFKIGKAVTFINPITFTPPQNPTSFAALQNGNFLWSFFASLDVERKAQDRLIKILSAETWKTRPWMLNLYGEGKDKTLLQRLIDENGLSQKVFLKGHTANVAEAMGQTHLVLQLTSIDAMPLSVLEAMAMARPVAVTRVGDMPAWVRDGENGWVCESNEEAIDACLEEAWNQREEWERMGQNSFAIFRQKFPTQPEEAFLQLLSSNNN